MKNWSAKLQRFHLWVSAAKGAWFDFPLSPSQPRSCFSDICCPVALYIFALLMVERNLSFADIRKRYWQAESHFTLPQEAPDNLETSWFSVSGGAPRRTLFLTTEWWLPSQKNMGPFIAWCQVKRQHFFHFQFKLHRINKVYKTWVRVPWSALKQQLNYR